MHEITSIISHDFTFLINISDMKTFMIICRILDIPSKTSKFNTSYRF